MEANKKHLNALQISSVFYHIGDVFNSLDTFAVESFDGLFVFPHTGIWKDIPT